MIQGLSCIVAAQVAEQISAAIGPWEIPVMPAWEIPTRTDEHGNSLPGVKRPPTDSYAELSRRTRQRRAQAAPASAPSATGVTPSPSLGQQTMPLENSPSFEIPSGPGGSQSRQQSPMDALPCLSPSLHRPPVRPPRVSEEPREAATNNTHVFTGDVEADGLIHQLIQEGSWSPLEYNALGTLDPIPPGFLFDAGSLLSDLMTCLTAAPNTFLDVATETRTGAEPSVPPVVTHATSQEESPRPETPPVARASTSKPKPSPRPAKPPSKRSQPH